MQIINKLKNRDVKADIDMIRIKTAVQAVKASVVGDKENCNMDKTKD